MGLTCSIEAIFCSLYVGSFHTAAMRLLYAPRPYGSGMGAVYLRQWSLILGHSSKYSGLEDGQVDVAEEDGAEGTANQAIQTPRWLRCLIQKFIYTICMYIYTHKIHVLHVYIYMFGRARGYKVKRHQ